MDGEVTTNAGEKDSEPALMVNEEAGGYSMTQRTAKAGRTQPQDRVVSLNVVTSSTPILNRDLQENQENRHHFPIPLGPNPHSHHFILSHQKGLPPPRRILIHLTQLRSLPRNEEKPVTMAEIIQRANSATGTPPGIKSYSSFIKGSCSTLRKIAPLHERRKTLPPFPPNPPPKKLKKQLELEEKWEEEFEVTIEGWAVLFSQERESRRRDVEMGFEDQ